MCNESEEEGGGVPSMRAARSGGSRLDHVVSICCNEYNNVATLQTVEYAWGEKVI